MMRDVLGAYDGEERATGFEGEAWLPLAIGAASALGGIVSGAKKQKKADKLSAESLRLQRQKDAQAEPFRKRLGELALGQMPQRQDLSSIFADPGNPYNRVQMPQAGPAMPPSFQMPQARPMGPTQPMDGGMGGGGGGLFQHLAELVRSRRAL